MPPFRRARPAPTSWLLAKTYLQMLVFWGLFLAVFPPVLARFGDRIGMTRMLFPYARPTAVVIFVMASALGVLSAYTMARFGRGTPLPLDAPRELVAVGPYARIRNPMAVAGLTQGAAVALWLGSLMVLGYVIAGGLLWNALVRPVEERDLEAQFGDGFRAYRRAVPLWIPRRVVRQDIGTPDGA